MFGSCLGGGKRRKLAVPVSGDASMTPPLPAVSSR